MTQQQQSTYDAVIVGGGIAGLTAAYMLRDQNVLLLEQSERLGGRVRGPLAAVFGETVALLRSAFRRHGPILVRGAAASRETIQQQHLRVFLTRATSMRLLETKASSPMRAVAHIWRSRNERHQQSRSK